jgi:hypothetical protein
MECFWLDGAGEFTFDRSQGDVKALKQPARSRADFGSEHEQEVFGADEAATMLLAKADRALDRVGCLVGQRWPRFTGFADRLLQSALLDANVLRSRRACRVLLTRRIRATVRVTGADWRPRRPPLQRARVRSDGQERSQQVMAKPPRRAAPFPRTGGAPGSPTTTVSKQPVHGAWVARPHSHQGYQPGG